MRGSFVASSERVVSMNVVMAQNHRAPAPRLKASVASRASAVVKRPRFAFTSASLVSVGRTLEPAAGRSP